MRYIALTDGTTMGGELIIFKTNAPVEILKSLEKESCNVYINGGDYEDVPIWHEVITEKGYEFEFIDSCRHITPYTSSREWLSEHEIGAKICEHYVIDDQPELNNVLKEDSSKDTKLSLEDRIIIAGEQCGQNSKQSEKEHCAPSRE